MKPPLRIAILECDTPLDGTKSRYGGYSGVFKALLEAAVDGLGRSDLTSAKEGLELSYCNVSNGEKYPTLEDVDAVLLTGSRYCSFDDTPWIVELVDFTKQLLRQDRIRIIGVCFGQQIIGRALGVKVDRGDKGWEASVLPVQLTEKGKEVFKAQELSLHQMHRDMVYELPADVELLGSSPQCEIQGMYAQGRFITVQGHPEFNQAIVTELLETRLKQGIFDQATFEDAMARVGLPHDGVVVAQAFLRFLLDE